jgi:exodeoxyribonuclease-3
MRIATYNVNGINGRLANLLGWLEETAPDIVCLQELKAPDEKSRLPRSAPPVTDAVWHGQKSWNGVAILARGAEPREIRRGCPATPAIRTVATSKPRSTARLWAVSICRRAIPRRA